MPYRSQLSIHFKYALDRGRTLCSLYDYLAAAAPAALDATDMLRSAIVLGVSALDHLVHQVILQEIEYRVYRSSPIFGVTAPVNLFGLPLNELARGVRGHVRESNSYKSFVAPSKISEGLRSIMNAPWPSIATHFGEGDDAIKVRLGLIVSLRNRIAHEADLDPQFATPQSYPIDRDDVLGSLVFLEKLGTAILAAVEDDRAAA